MLVVTTTIYPPVEQAHEQEAVTAADKHHRACPDMLDDGMHDVPSPTQCHHRYACAQQQCNLLALLHRTLQGLPSQDTCKDRHDEVQAAEYPSIGVRSFYDYLTVDNLGCIAETTEHYHVDAFGEIAVRGVVAAAVTANRNPFHSCPKHQEQSRSDANLCFPASVQVYESAEEISYGNGL